MFKDKQHMLQSNTVLLKG